MYTQYKQPLFSSPSTNALLPTFSGGKPARSKRRSPGFARQAPFLQFFTQSPLQELKCYKTSNFTRPFVLTVAGRACGFYCC